jgi:hypothetical protein
VRSEKSMGNPESAQYRQAYRLLLEARDLVVRGWSSGAPARDGEGRAVEPSHPSARSWSLAGALEAASGRRDGTNEDASARAVASAALAAAVSDSHSESEALRILEGAIRDLKARQRRQLDVVEINTKDPPLAVRCLRCGALYWKHGRREILALVQECPSCGYQGWSFAEPESQDRDDDG